MPLPKNLLIVVSIIVFFSLAQLWANNERKQNNVNRGESKTRPSPIVATKAPPPQLPVLTVPSPAPILFPPFTVPTAPAHNAPVIPTTPVVLHSEPTSTIPSVGIIFFYHIPKCGGTGVDGIVGRDSLMDHLPPHYYFEEEKQKVIEVMDSMIENPRLIMFEQHASGDPQFTSMEWLIPLRNKYRSEGYTFDIFIFLRDPIDYIISTFNYYSVQNHIMNMPATFEEWMNTASNLQTNYIRTSHSAGAGDFFFRPWETSSGAIDHNFSPHEFMTKYDDFLDQMDFVGFTKEMDWFATYLTLRHNIPRKEPRIAVNPSKKIVDKPDITPAMMTQFNANNILDYMLITKAHRVSSDRIQGYITKGWNVDQTNP